jgi:hypothetical protein
VHPGDLLRFTYTSRQDAHLALINVDQQAVTVYFPSGGSTSQPIRAADKQALDFSVELDDRTGTERVFAVFCPEPFSLAAAMDGLRGPQPAPPEGCLLDRITLEKAPKP